MPAHCHGPADAHAPHIIGDPAREPFDPLDVIAP